MDSARDTAAASDAVISPRLCAMCTLREPPPGWLCLIRFKPGVGEALKGPFAESFEPSDETEKLLVQASKLDWSQVGQPAWMPRSLDSRQFASQQLERSSEEPVQQAHRKHWWKLPSYYFGSCMYVWFGHLWFLSIKFHHITCF